MEKASLIGSQQEDMYARVGDNEFGQTNSPFRYGKRQSKDGAYAIAFFVLLVALIIGGAYAVNNRNRNFEDIMHGKINITLASSCPTDAMLQSERRYYRVYDDKPEFDADSALKVGMIAVISSIFISILLGCLLVWVFIKKSDFAMRFTVVVQIGIPLIAMLVTLIKGVAVLPIIFGIMAALNALLFYIYRRQLAICSKLLEVAATGLRENHLLVPTTLALKVVGLIVILPAFASGVVAYMNGHVVPNEGLDVTKDGTCVDQLDNPVSCCQYKVDNWVGPFMGLVGLSIAWTFNLIFEIRLFMSSSAIVQWYYTPVGLHRQTKAIGLGLYHAVFPQFGTNCFGSLVLVIADIIRNAADKVSQGGDRSSIFNVLMRVVVAVVLDCVASIVEYLTKFTTIMASITGENFCSSARATYDLLARNFLSSLAVWWVPGTVLGVMTFTLSIVWSLLLSIFLYAMYPSQLGMVIFVSIISFIFTIIALNFVATMLTLAVDACYICYALDLDRQAQYRKEVHEIFDTVRKEQPIYQKNFADGPVIEQPNGSYAYGA